ncbi:chromate transporter, partial [[Kluyvera] intestini]
MLKDLLIAFFRAGMLGYGGGLSAIPLMQREVVERYKWMDDDEFSNILALANTLPG